VSVTQLLRRGLGLGRRAIAFATPSKPKEGMDDQTLKTKVESTIFRDSDTPKGSVDVNVVDGVVELRGEVKRPEIKEALEKKARAIPEVWDVRNHLHLPKTPAPTRADSPGRARRKASTTGEPPKTTERVTGERAVEGAEPSPAELAEQGGGRRAAPFGSGEGDAR
jgi:hypothetical protein